MLDLRRGIWKETCVIIRFTIPRISLHSFNVNVAAAIYKLSVLGANKKHVAPPFIPQELCPKYGFRYQPCDPKLNLLIASPNLVQNRPPNSSFQQRGLHNWDRTNIANERMPCARSGPKNKTRPMATESKGKLGLRRVLAIANCIQTASLHYVKDRPAINNSCLQSFNPSYPTSTNALKKGRASNPHGSILLQPS